MIKRIIYLAVPVIILAGIGLTAAQKYISSFPPSKAVIESLAPLESVPASMDMTESFFDDSGSMRGYYSEHYIELLRTLKSHIREMGEYKYYAFSDPEHKMEGDEWELVEQKRFYNQNDTYFDKVLDSIADKVRSGNQTAKNFLIITDGIQDVSQVQDYSRIVDKVSDLLDAGLFFQIIAIKLPFDGYKYPEGGGYIPYKGSSPLFCYIFTYNYDFGRELYAKLNALNLTVNFMGFGNKNINAVIKQFSEAAKNSDGSRNTFKRFKDEIPLTYLVSRAGTGGTLLTDVTLNAKDVNVNRDEFKQKTPEFCGQCMPVDSSGHAEKDLSGSTPDVAVSTREAVLLSDDKDNLEINYSMFFRNWDRESETLACDLTLCNWLPVIPPDWINDWSSDCDNTKKCFEGKTPFLSNLIDPILKKSVRKYTFGYVVIRNQER